MRYLFIGGSKHMTTMLIQDRPQSFMVFNRAAEVMPLYNDGATYPIARYVSRTEEERYIFRRMIHDGVEIPYYQADGIDDAFAFECYMELLEIRRCIESDVYNQMRRRISLLQITLRSIANFVFSTSRRARTVKARLPRQILDSLKEAA